MFPASLFSFCIVSLFAGVYSKELRGSAKKQELFHLDKSRLCCFSYDTYQLIKT